MVPVLWDGAGDGVPDIPLPYPTWKGEGTSMGRGPTACGGVKYLVTTDYGYIDVPGQGLQGGGDKIRPPGKLCTPPHVGYNSDHGGGKPYPSPIP